MNKNARYWAIGGIVVLVLVLIWIMFSAGNSGGSGQNNASSQGQSTSESASGTQESSTAASQTTSGSAHSGHDMGAQSASADENLSAYLRDQDEQMDRMMTGMRDIPQSGNAAVDFLTGMIPHHQAAVEMAESYLKYGAENEELKKLAQDIIQVQKEEIAQMEQMAKDLKSEGGENEDQAKAYRAEYDKMFEDGSHAHHMPGSSPATVDEAFAEGMRMHHEMAVDMARSILEYTDQKEVTQLANGIIEQQEQEIQQMDDILTHLRQGH